MRRHIKIPNERELDVTWSNVRWVPHIEFVQAADCASWLEGLSPQTLSEGADGDFEAGSNPKRGQKRQMAVVLWVRPASGAATSTQAGTRLTWR
jgi:hypothetical protein